MKIEKSTFHLIHLFILSILLSGCGENSVETKMYGTWEISAFFSNAEFKKFSEEPIPDGVEIEMTMKGKQSYHKGGKYSAECELTMRVKTAEGEIPLKFHIKDAGEWSLHASGKELVETSADGTFTALDELTEAVLKESPEFAASFKPIKGQTTTSRILSISETVMEIQEDESKITLTMNKKRQGVDPNARPAASRKFDDHSTVNPEVGARSLSGVGPLGDTHHKQERHKYPLALLPFMLLWARMSHFGKLTLAELPKATEDDLQQMRSASKTAFFMILACTILSFLPYAFTPSRPTQADVSTANGFAIAFTIGGVLISAFFDRRAHNIKKRCQTDADKSAERGHLCWYHVLVSILLPYIGVVWGIINLATKRRKSGLAMTLISGIWIAIIVTIILATSHAN